MRLAFVSFPLSKVVALSALGLWAGRLRSAGSHRFKLGDDHYAWNGLFDYINDDGFFGGFGRLSRRLGPSRFNFLGGRLPCTRFASQLLGPRVLGCLSSSGADFFCAGLSAFRNRPLSCQCLLFSLSHDRLPLISSANVSASENQCPHPQHREYTGILSSIPVDGCEAEEFGYLAVILDAFSRKVVGWALQEHLRAELAISALTMAITARQPKPGALIHHSDRGVQYACTEYTEILAVHDIRPSMSRIGNPYDNAKAESFMKTLKQEEINGNSYRNLSQARGAIGAFIETVYNRQRLHSALAYRSPDEYEATLGRFLGGLTSPPEVSIAESCY